MEELLKEFFMLPSYLILKMASKAMPKETQFRQLIDKLSFGQWIEVAPFVVIVYSTLISLLIIHIFFMIGLILSVLT